MAQFLCHFHNRLALLRPGEKMVVPGGWHRSTGGHAILHVIERQPDASSSESSSKPSAATAPGSLEDRSLEKPFLCSFDFNEHDQLPPLVPVPGSPEYGQIVRVPVPTEDAKGSASEPAPASAAGLGLSAPASSAGAPAVPGAADASAAAPASAPATALIMPRANVTPSARYSFIICNSGNGTQFHPAHSAHFPKTK